MTKKKKTKKKKTNVVFIQFFKTEGEFDNDKNWAILRYR
jgi:hypothetical protein